MFLRITLGGFFFFFVMKSDFLHIHRIPGVRALRAIVQQRQMVVFSKAEKVEISHRMRFSFKNTTIQS